MGIEEPGKPGVLQRKQGSLYRLDQRGGKKMADGIDISNGLTWNSDLKYVLRQIFIILQDTLHMRNTLKKFLFENATIFDPSLRHSFE